MFDPVSLGIMAGGTALSALAPLFAKKPTYKQLSRLTPQQQQAQSALIQQSLGSLQNPYEGFEPLQAQAERQFAQEYIPSIAERFTSMGGGQRSSAFQGALGSAASGLAGQLASLKSQYGLQNRSLGLQGLQLGLTPSFDTIQRQGSNGFADLLSGLGGTATQFGGQYGAYQGQKANINRLLAGLNPGNNQGNANQPPASAGQDVAALQGNPAALPFNAGMGQNNFQSALMALLGAGLR